LSRRSSKSEVQRIKSIETDNSPGGRANLELSVWPTGLFERILGSAKEFHTVRTSTWETFISEFRKDEISKENLDQVIAQNRVRMDELIGVLADGIVEFHRMLSPQQRDKLVAELEKHKKKGCWYSRRW